MSRRQRKTNNGITDFGALLEAIKEVKVDKKPKKTIARAYNIPKSSFIRYIQKFDKEIPDITEVSDYVLLQTIRKIASYTKTAMVWYTIDL